MVPSGAFLHLPAFELGDTLHGILFPAQYRRYDATPARRRLLSLYVEGLCQSWSNSCDFPIIAGAKNHGAMTGGGEIASKCESLLVPLERVA